MAIIPRYTSRALPEGVQDGLMKSAIKRGEAGAGLAAAFGNAIVAGVDYKERKAAADTAEKAYWMQVFKEMNEGLDGRGDSIEGFVPFGDLDTHPVPDGWTVGFGNATPAGDSAAAAGAGGGMAMRTGQQKQVRTALDRQSDETLLASLETAMTQARAAAQAAAAKPVTPARDMARLALAQFDRDVARLSKGIADRPDLKSRFDALAVSSRAPMELRMLTAENARRANEEKAVLSESLAGLALAAGVDPAMAPGVTGRGFAQIEAAMKAGMLDPEEAAAMQGAFAENVHMSAMRSQIAADPAQALEKLESGEFDDVFEPAARNMLLGEARTTARVRAAGGSAAARARRRGLELDMAAHLAALDAAGAGDEALDARARAELPDFQYAAFQAGQARARERHATRAEYAFMTAREIEADIDAGASGDGPSDDDERVRTHAIRKAVRDEVLAARAADPAGWAMRDEDVAAAFAVAEENPDDPALARKATELRLALQREMGIDRPRLLSEAERDGIVEQLSVKAPAERGAELHNLWKRHGLDYGRLVAELGDQVDADTLRLARYAMQPRLAEPLAKGMGKARTDGPAEADGDAPLIPLVAETSGPDTRIDLSRMKPFRQYLMPDGDRMAYDGDALVPVAAAQVVAAPQILPGGATLWPGSEGRAGPTDWSSLIEQVPKLSARAGLAAAGTAASILLTPWNAQEEYRYFGDGARLRTAPGELFGTVQQLDPATGEWLQTELVGFIVGAGIGAVPSVVAGTPAQVERAREDSFRPPDGQLPPPPPLIPPAVPDTGRETFPATENHPDVHETPQETSHGHTETFPIPDAPRAQADIFLAISDEIIREVTKPLEAHRGDEYTRRGNDIVVQKVYEQLERWFPDVTLEDIFEHEAGATLHGEGRNKLKERIVRDDVTGSYSIPDIKIRDTASGKWIALNTGAVLRDGTILVAAERRQLERLKQNLGDTGVAAGLPKLRPGVDEAEYIARVEKQLGDFFNEYFGRPPPE